MQAKKTPQKQANTTQSKSTATTSSQNQKTSKPESQTKTQEKTNSKANVSDKKTEKQEKEQKTETKTQNKKDDQQQKQPQQQQQQQQQKEEEKKQEVPKQKVEGSSIVKYSHYKTNFKHFDGKLQWKLVDEEYCISDVFVGNFKPHIVNELKQQLQEETGQDGQKYFLNLETGKVYTLIIDEDSEEENKREHVGYKAQGEESSTVNSKRKEGCSCVFGNPCQDPEACLDWKNKEAVAKKNGWKGFN